MSLINNNGGSSAMNSSTQAIPISDLKSRVTEIEKTPSISTQKEHVPISDLLEVLVLGNREIEQGEFRSAGEVFTELDQEDTQ